MKYKKTIATAESLTGGLISATLVEVPGASNVVKGGFVTYQTVAKTMLLGVPEQTIEEHNVVSAEVARRMAEGAREKLKVDIAVSATGLAGPGGGTPDRPVGTVFLGISTSKETKAVELHLSGDRARIRQLTVKYALDCVRKQIEAENA
jgi:PncC family amidohydrolase